MWTPDGRAPGFACCDADRSRLGQGHDEADGRRVHGRTAAAHARALCSAPSKRAASRGIGDPDAG
eukprot:12227425-Alexandrium_andersonii.AAC.1